MLVVVVPVAVTDASGNAIQGLRKEDFRLEEEGRAQELQAVGTAEEVPLDIVILFDISSSVTAKSFFALAEPGSCFAGNLLELLLASDRSYMLNDPERPVELAVGELNAGALPMSNGLTRLQSRFLAEPERADEALEHEGRFDTEAAEEAGLVTFAPDDLDWEDEVRVAIEERTSLSPDALTGMEASLRFAGPENLDTKIFGRLTAWQNWIFQRPNAVGPQGALTNYGKPTQPQFDYKRT